MDAIIRKFAIDDAEELNSVIEYTIEESYKWIYPEEVREIFKEENSTEQLVERGEKDYVLVVVNPDDENKIVGTGALIDNRIFGVYVHPEYQSNGIGVRIMEQLEDRALGNGIKKLVLSASISSKDFYRKLGYRGDPRIIKLDDRREYIVYDMDKELD